MAALWALTGSMDPRRAQDLKVADVVNDESEVGGPTALHLVKHDRFFPPRLQISKTL